MRSIRPQECDDDPPPGWVGSHEDQLVTVILEVSAALRRGEPVDARKYRGFEDDLRHYLPTIKALVEYARFLKDDSEC